MLYYAQGSALITEDELFEKPAYTKLSQFYDDLEAKRKPSVVRFSTGTLALDNVIHAIEVPDAAPVPFQNIGPGRPLTIEIREVYTGKYPSGGLFGSKKDMLVTSAIKSIGTFAAQPRAINFLTGDISAKSRLLRPSAAEPGTPIVFYSPALLEKSLTLDLTIVFDQFSQEVFTTIGNTFKASARIPIFLLRSVHWLAAGAIAKIIGAVGEALFDGQPVFTASVPVHIHWPGEPPLRPGFALITEGNVDRMDRDFRSKYQVNAAGQVVDQSGSPYDGDIPYVVISFDGAPREELASFAPTAACAAILSRFFGIKEGQAQPLESLLDAIKLYNDFNFRQDIERLDKRLAGLPAGEEKTRLVKKREALAKNILTELLQKPAAF